MPHNYDKLDVNTKLIWNFRDIGHTMRSIYEGKGSQKRILIILNESGVITQREMTQKLGIQPGSVSEVLGKLESAGLITRTSAEADRRTTDVQLTQAGKVAAEEATNQRKKRHDQMFACLSEKEKDELLSLLEKVNLSWDKIYRKDNGEHSRV